MNIDNKKIFKKLDKGRVGESLEYLPDQMRQVLDEARLIKIPSDYKKVTQVVVNGMGGSNLGTHFTRSAWADKIKVPVTITPGYEIPAHVNKNTLFLISSYSGTTEEPLSVYREVKKRGAKIVGITENSKQSRLAKLMLKENIPGYIFDSRYNPSEQPRLGLGYSIFGQAVIMAKAGLFEIKVRAMENIIASMEIWTRKLRSDVPSSRNAAKKIALKIQNKIPVFIGAEHTVGNLHIIRNQVNECSKNFASYLEIPDLNHYAMEGLRFPITNKKNLALVLFASGLYHKRVQKRINLTKNVVNKNNVATIEYKLSGPDRLTQSFELLQLGAWISYYLGIINNIDPAKIPYVDWFKKQLK